MAVRLRRLAERLATDDLDAVELDALALRLDGVLDDLPVERPERTRFARGQASAERHPIAEGASAVYPPFVVTGDEDLLVATTRFDGAWEGPPDLVHGGYLAAGFDMVLSSMAHRVLGHSVTRRLQVRYLKPTFLGSELRYEVEASEPRGRLLSLSGRLYADDRLTMRASAEFASLDQGRFADRRGDGSRQIER